MVYLTIMLFIYDLCVNGIPTNETRDLDDVCHVFNVCNFFFYIVDNHNIINFKKT